MKSYLFPGQGAQTVTMAKEIVSEYPKALSIYEEARTITGTDLLDIEADSLDQTRFAQLAIVVHSVASLEKYRASLDRPEKAAVAGFSLGEYPALYAAGVIGFSDLLRLVDERARLMQEAAERNPGAMFAIIGLSDERVEEIISHYDEVYAVNYNCPGQLVIAGKTSSAEAAAEALLAEGARRAHRLTVNGAFHTKMMKEAADGLEGFARKITFRAPQILIYSNTTAAPIPENTDFPAYLAKHMVSPVRFTEEIRRLRADGYDEHLELGPGRVLTGLVRKI
jgi:[acyl-carrier-protein] S-malonyltransferase